METSCQEKPVATLTVITSTSGRPSLFCTSIPPGLTSHSISPRPPLLASPPSLLLLLLPPAVLPLEELLLNSFLEHLSFIIVANSPKRLLAPAAMESEEEEVEQ